MNNHESYVSFETAQLLKRAGFDWKADTYYQHGILRDGWCSNKNKEDMITCSAPALSVAQRWLREVKEQYVLPYPIAGNWYFAILRPNFGRYYRDQQFDNYESALEAGIKKCLTLLLKEE